MLKMLRLATCWCKNATKTLLSKLPKEGEENTVVEEEQRECRVQPLKCSKSACGRSRNSRSRLEEAKRSNNADVKALFMRKKWPEEEPSKCNNKCGAHMAWLDP